MIYKVTVTGTYADNTTDHTASDGGIYTANETKAYLNGQTIYFTVDNNSDTRSQVWAATSSSDGEMTPSATASGSATFNASNAIFYVALRIEGQGYSDVAVYQNTNSEAANYTTDENLVGKLVPVTGHIKVSVSSSNS